jgi:hypothetical protein
MTLLPDSLSLYLASKNFSRIGARRVDKEIPRPRHALVLPRGFRIQDKVFANRFRIRIGQQRKIDLLPVREVFQDRLRVVADGRQFETLFFESCFRGLQLDQLPFAVRSPVRGPEEQ